MFGPTLAEANRIIATAFECATRLDLKPISVAVLDPGGHLIAFQRQDDASMLRFEIALGKAYGALAIGVSSREVEKIAVARPHLMLGLSGVSGGKIVPVSGGVLMRSNNQVVGAVGVTGDTSDNDEACAVAGIESIGFAAQR
ncbi:GlcG/HbpS family heme-binding protein [Bradyrhizobium icense]|uniref:GlcG protein n=1 Tax=Bradyrhizobium icense TaxID=1274631 RepID=A0A1B1UBK1_9BRAD|nr:heme-binding protein [Bradyrhizobium icense]ANW00145.1 GlcG protein [Bradyrhizobium icense]